MLDRNGATIVAEPLKHHFDSEIPGKIAGMIGAVFPQFEVDAFVRDAIDKYEDLDLMQRGWKIARTLRRYLPDDYAKAAEIIVASLGTKIEKTEGLGMAPFLYLPHVCFVAEYGLDHFDVSMRAQYELTQRFSAEFSIRPYLERYPEATLARLKTWTQDPSAHVRRLVSEGTRPRLPWASRLRAFQVDPRPVLALLELLKDDSELYVRRSVANNLNDIGKDHPVLLVETARHWMSDATEERRWLIRHALRSAIKRAETGALDVLGFGNMAKVSVRKVSITPKLALIGESAAITFEITNTDSQQQRVLVDFCVHYMKANGKTSPKVFKLKAIELAPQETVQLGKTISLSEMTTRKHYPGTHKVDVILNGRADPLGTFELVES